MQTVNAFFFFQQSWSTLETYSNDYDCYQNISPLKLNNDCSWHSIIKNSNQSILNNPCGYKLLARQKQYFTAHLTESTEWHKKTGCVKEANHLCNFTLSMYKQMFLQQNKLPLTELLPTCVWRLCSMAMGFETSLVDEERGRGTCSSLELLLLIALQHIWGWVIKYPQCIFLMLLCCLHSSLHAQLQAWTLCIIVKQFRPWMVSCSVVVAVSTWLVTFPYAPKKNSVQWFDFCGLKVYRSRNPSKTFSTIWEQCFATTQCVRMGCHVKKRMIWTPVHVHYRRGHWTSPCHDSG
jgi:hypothetical protein